MLHNRKLIILIAGLVVAAAAILGVLLILNKPNTSTCTIHPDPTNICLDNTYKPE